MKRYKHSLSHYKLMTCNMGNIVPVTWYEALPGDSIQQRSTALVRLQPLIAPVMHPVVIRFHHWFVPLRLIWDDFEDFITGGPDGTFEAQPPTIVLNGNIGVGSLFDYLGVPPRDYSTNPTGFSALPLRAYQFIFNEWYRDQDLVNEVHVNTASGNDGTTSTSMRSCAWEKDYFTTCRPWEQKGNEVTIPIGGEAPVTGIGRSDQVYGSAASNVYVPGGKTEDWGTSAAGFSNALMQEDPDNTGFPNIFADLSQATGITVNELREALAIQRYQEARAKYGSRYVEYLRYLGIKNPSDARLQNPEYLGGSKTVVQFSEVLQTQRSDSGESPLGTMGGHGIAAMRGRRWRRFFEEHGIVMTLMSAVPKSIYMDGFPRKFNRLNKEMYFQKELQFLGDQRVLNKEIQGSHSQIDGVFGYQDRYDEYRYEPSGVAGEFRDTLNYWHMARDLSAGDVALNSSFVTCNPTNRIYASQDTDQLYMYVNNSIQARRLLVRNATPRTF